MNRFLPAASLLAASLAFAQPGPGPGPGGPGGPPPPPPGMGGHGPGMMGGPGFGGPGMHGPMGIPPPVAAKLGLSPEVTKQVREASLDANEALITLEADHKRAQLELERVLGEPRPDESKVMQKLELISKAELAVRKNRVGLMLKVRKLIGPEAWEKLQAEMPGPGGRMGPPPPPQTP